MLYLKGSNIKKKGEKESIQKSLKHHLANNILGPESTILFVGYQASGMLGRIILEKPKDVRIFGQTYQVKARIEKINCFFAHADRDEFVRWVTSIEKRPKKVFIVHSETSVAANFASLLRAKMKIDVAISKYKEEMTI